MRCATVWIPETHLLGTVLELGRGRGGGRDPAGVLRDVRALARDDIVVVGFGARDDRANASRAGNLGASAREFHRDDAGGEREGRHGLGTSRNAPFSTVAETTRARLPGTRESGSDAAARDARGARLRRGKSERPYGISRGHTLRMCLFGRRACLSVREDSSGGDAREGTRRSPETRARVFQTRATATGRATLGVALPTEDGAEASRPFSARFTPSPLPEEAKKNFS